MFVHTIMFAHPRLISSLFLSLALIANLSMCLMRSVIAERVSDVCACVFLQTLLTFVSHKFH